MSQPEDELEKILRSRQPAIEEILMQLQEHVCLPRFPMMPMSYNKGMIENLAVKYKDWQESTMIDLKDFFDSADVVDATFPAHLSQEFLGQDVRTAEGFANLFSGEIFARALDKVIERTDSSIEHGSSGHQMALKEFFQRLVLLQEVAAEKWVEAGALLERTIQSNTPRASRGR